MLRQALRFLLISIAIAGGCLRGSSTTHAATIDCQGIWIDTATSATGCVVIYNECISYSAKSTTSTPDENHTLGRNPTCWANIGTVGTTILSGPGIPTSAHLGQLVLKATASSISGSATPITQKHHPNCMISAMASSVDSGTLRQGSEVLPWQRQFLICANLMNDVESAVPPSTKHLLCKNGFEYEHKHNQ